MTRSVSAGMIPESNDPLQRWYRGWLSWVLQVLSSNAGTPSGPGAAEDAWGCALGWGEARHWLCDVTPLGFSSPPPSATPSAWHQLGAASELVAWSRLQCAWGLGSNKLTYSLDRARRAFGVGFAIPCGLGESALRALGGGARPRPHMDKPCGSLERRGFDVFRMGASSPSIHEVLETCSPFMGVWGEGSAGTLANAPATVSNI